jgi:integrase
MSGHIVERGPNRWAIVLETREGGRRKQRWHAFRGNKRAAQVRLAELIAASEHGTYIAPSKITLAAYIDQWLRNVAPVRAREKTVRRYGELGKHITGTLGDRRLQSLRGDEFTALYLALAGKKLAPRTIQHVHTLVRMVLKHALEQGDIKRALKISTPSRPATEAPVLKSEEVSALLGGLRDSPMYPIVTLALATGMRRGELLGLQWQDIDLEGGKLEVRRSLEQTGRALQLKEPKTKRGRRIISLPASAVACLRTHRKEQLEMRLKFGLGRPEGDALVFSTIEGRPLVPDDLSRRFVYAMAKIGLGHVTLHALRHYHGSELLQAGIDIATVSRRLGHSTPAITLGVYTHVVRSEDRSADVLEAVLKGRGIG